MKTAWQSTSAGAGLLILIVVAAYWPALRAGFVFDDSVLITNSPLTKADDGLYRIWCTSEAGDYWPITYSAWWLQWRLWGGKAAGFHAVNVGLHAIDSVLVWIILRRLKVPGAWLAAALFAVHPVNVATVAWVSEQKNTLSMLFFAVSILLYLKFEEEGERKWYVFSLVAFAAALLSKASVVMEPVVLLGLAWWRRGRIGTRDLWRTVPFFALSLAAASVTIGLQQKKMLIESSGPPEHLPGQLAEAGWALWFYLYKTVLPVNLILIYPNWKVDAAWWVVYVPAAAVAGAFGIFWWKRESWGRPLLFGLGYFAVTLFPVLGFFHQNYFAFSRVADQWLYSSIIGVLGLVCAGAAVVWRRMNLPWRNVGAVAGAGVFLLLCTATWKRCEVFASQETVWRDTIEKNPQAWLGFNNLAVALGEHGKFDEAIGLLRRAIELKSDYAEAYSNMGTELVGEGKLDEAMPNYRRALQLRPNDGDARKHIAELDWREGHAQEAIEYWYEALEVEPDSIDVLNNLAWALATSKSSDGGDPVRAVAFAEQACELTQYREATYLDTLGVAYAAAGRFGEAVGAAQKGVQLARSAGDEELAKKIEGRVELYREGKGYQAGNK